MVTSSLLIATMALALGQAKDQAALADPVDHSCMLHSIADIKVPAEESGALASLEVKEGMYVKEGMELGHIDYREAEALLAVKKYDFDVAEYKANSDVSVRYARKAAEVAKKVYEKYELANKGGPLHTVAATELMKYKLEADKAILGVEKEIDEIKVNLLTSKGKGAEVQAAKISLAKRTLKAPCDGVIVKVLRQVGEWVAPGDTVFRIVRVDRLRAVGSVDASLYAHSDVDGRPVTIEIMLPRGRKVEVTGKVVSVSPIIVGGTLPITAEIETPMENGRPVVRAGQTASMTIHVNGPAPAAARSEPARPNKKTG